MAATTRESRVVQDAARIALAVPILISVELLTSGSLPRATGGPVQPWVYVWHMVNVLPNTALVRGRTEEMALINALALVQLLAGLTIGERTAGVYSEKVR